MPDVAPPRDPIFACAGEMAERCASLDWSTSPLGVPSSWPQSLRTAVATVLRSRFAMTVTWGESLLMIYNDDYIDTLGPKHPAALGQGMPEVFPEVWADLEAQQHGILRDGDSAYFEDVPFVIERGGVLEERFSTFCSSHIPPGDETAGPGGILTILTPRTREVVGAGRLALLNSLISRTSLDTDPGAAIAGCLEVLGGATSEFTHGCYYAVDPDDRLVAVQDFGEAPRGLDAGDGAPRLASDCLHDAATIIVHRQGSSVVALPVRARGRVAGVLLLAPSPLRLLDDDHRRWLELIGEHVSQALSTATARSDEQARLAALAQLDAAKSDFLSNVSHELRTPLTLLLGPLEEIVADPEKSLSRTQVEVMRRSGNRLLRLVTALMDAARADVGPRTSDAHLVEPIDLTVLTRDLVLAFEPAAVQAGLMMATRFEETGVLGLDPALWESVVTNLITNAIKYTPTGLVEVTLTVDGDQVALRVRDSGVGIPESQHEHIFERFHRVLGPDAVSVEGTGLGLSLVAEATRALGGTVMVASEPAGGSVFTVSIPRTPPPGERVTVRHPVHGAQLVAQDLLSTLDRTAGGPSPDNVVEPARTFSAGLPTILVVDDNQDMRQHLVEVLAPLGQVVTSRDGIAALEVLAKPDRPGSSGIDLVVTDVTMPRLDGLGLVERLRADPRHSAVPVVVLSARAGPEAAASALELGADDYVVKPFTSTDLLARCRSTMMLARMREDQASASARDAVLAGVSHEMQTPLSVIMTALDLIALPDTDDLTRAEAARRATARIRVLDRLVRQFLDWSRITAGAPIVALRAPIALHDVVDAVLLEHPRAEVTGTGLDSRPHITCDVRRTEQILHTLLSQAERSAHNRVEVEIVEACGPDGEVVGYDVVVSDDGPAVDERVLRGLVTPTPMAGTPSTGAIGLAVSRAAARAQGGDLTLGSGHQHGSVFVLRLASGA